MREDLISSAISFLSDPKVQSSPLAKKVSFLESKGMTSEEIEEAMARLNGRTPAPAPLVQPTLPPPVPARPSFDWRDIFIAAVLAGGFSYGVWTLAKRLFGPWFKVPTQKEMEEDKERLDAQFQLVEDSLKEMKEQNSAALTTIHSQTKKVDGSLESLDKVMKELKEGDQKRDDEFKHIKSDIESLKEVIPKSLERNKEAQTAVIVELQNEMKSLKSLFASRRTVDPVVTPTTDLSSRLSATLNGSNARAGIPAWQMASTNTPTEPTESSSQAEK
ncbi:peroxisomal membrane anchor protein conserved region-domain-containing protein [Pilobolus umbonatus]|nr:peroxisomal membrane anchor protein conserved region-domain-containing protein [Pilobolus umbonatus]